MAVTPETPFTGIPGHHRRAEVECVEYLCESLPTGLPVVEFFGGLGLLHDVFQARLAPASHYMSELDRDLYDGLVKRLAGTGTVVEWGNAYVLAPPQIRDGSLVSIDFNKYTIFTLLDSAETRWTLGHLRTRGARWVHITDAATFRLHMNGYAYTRRLGRPAGTPEQYIAACEPVYAELLDWRLVSSAYHRGAAHLLFHTGD